MAGDLRFGRRGEPFNPVCVRSSRNAKQRRKWLSIADLKKLLRKSAYSFPNKIRLPAFRKLVSHRLLVEQSTSARRTQRPDGQWPGGFRWRWIRPDRAYNLTVNIARIRRVVKGGFCCSRLPPPKTVKPFAPLKRVLVTSGGLLSHAGVTTREFAIPSLILRMREWMQSAEGTMVRVEEIHPGKTTLTEEGFW